VINWAFHFGHLAPLNEAPECCSLISCELDILSSGQWLCRLHIQAQELGQEEETMDNPCRGQGNIPWVTSVSSVLAEGCTKLQTVRYRL
jgi:hypothetical protein